MARKERWILPDGIEEVLPADAWRLETLRRRILDLFTSWGYELVMPPMIEYLDSLLTGVSEDLDLQTFKITDQLSGRMMGIRPDITPQAARIDAHYLKRNAPVRLCYLGPVLQTRPGDFAASREPLQLGAELFGDAGIESDVEVLALMVAMLETLGIEDINIDLGHVGVFQGLAQASGLTAAQETTLFSALQRKARPEIDQALNEWNITGKHRQMLIGLLDLNGTTEVLAQAQQQLAKAPATVHQAIDTLQAVADVIARRYPTVSIYIDLAEVSGYGYHTGIVFSAFTAGNGWAIAKGGRYDGIGEAFGRARPATGFSADLRQLVTFTGSREPAQLGILAPADDEPALQQTIDSLRAQGERVLITLPGSNASAKELGCNRILVKQKNEWAVVAAEKTKS